MIDILIIEDNEELAGLLRDFLIRDGYSCSITPSGEQALEWLEQNKVRLVLLDIMLPGIDGFHVCDVIHRQRNLPVIVLSARTGKDDKLSMLELGADDYIEKPYDMDVLLAKIGALFRRHYDTATENQLITEGGFTVNPDNRIITHNGKPLSLGVKEYDLLAYLIRNKGKVIRKDSLFDIVWGVDSFSEPATLTVHIKWLRDKIEKDSKQPRHIVTVWGVGYRFEV
jgi:Response regulators consisting of a CheY-like receiver domain and a winged-helix DNA-binding domain